MKSCGLVLTVHGTEDDLISCFKEGKKCAKGRPLLKTQMLNPNDGILHINQFELLEEGVTAAAPSFNLTEEEDKDPDADIDI